MDDRIINIRHWKKDGKDKISVIYSNWRIVRFDAYRLEEIEKQIGKKIEIGSEIPFKLLYDTENFLWKQKYSGSRGKEKERIDKVKNELMKYFNNISFEDVGFGVESTEVIYSHPKESGAPDLEVTIDGYMFPLEVTGKQGCGSTLWVRPDKIEYCKSHEMLNYRVAHVCDQENKIFFIHIDLQKNYKASILQIRGSDEEMVIFRPEDVEVYPLEKFVEFMKGEIKNNY